MRFLLVLAVFLLSGSFTIAQDGSDTLKTYQLDEVMVTGYRAMNGIGHFGDYSTSIIFAGKKTEVLEVDSLQANRAINNTRQILGRIPGLNIVESETGGFIANGIGIRGLNPIQSTEMNVRQNGYNIAADTYGYNEVYFLPPMEAVKRVEVIKGASGLQFGPHPGGMINYILNDANPGDPFELVISETGGNLGLLNTFLSVGGSKDKFSYYGFVQHRLYDGWRPNSNQRQLSGFARVTFQPSDRLKIGLEYSMLRNRVKMPGGLTDEQYAADSQASYRSRNWVNSPWNVINASLETTIGTGTLTLNSTSNLSARNLVWFDEPSDEMDLRDGVTGLYVNREVEKKYMRSNANELRYFTKFVRGKFRGNIASGVRFSYAWFEQLEDGVGTPGSDDNYSVLNNEFEEELEFTTLNIAPYAEATFYLSDRFSITPGIRFEYVKGTVEGEKEDGDSGQVILINESRSRNVFLSALGLQYETGKYTNLYANLSQTFKPITYSQLIPLGVVSNIDPDLKDSNGYSADFGFRGTVKSLINFDVSMFYLYYGNRVGIEQRIDQNDMPYSYRTNTGVSVHKGLEAYIEVDLLGGDATRRANVSVFTSSTLVQAEYVEGENKGNDVEYAPSAIIRTGVVLDYRGFGTTIQHSYQSDAYGDATNAISGTDGIVGIVPAYQVWDWSSSYTWKQYQVKAGMNNVFDSRYFTYRTDEYPGPGIMPAIGRSFYVGFSAKF